SGSECGGGDYQTAKGPAAIRGGGGGGGTGSMDVTAAAAEGKRGEVATTVASGKSAGRQRETAGNPRVAGQRTAPARVGHRRTVKGAPPLVRAVGPGHGKGATTTGAPIRCGEPTPGAGAWSGVAGQGAEGGRERRRG